MSVMMVYAGDDNAVVRAPAFAILVIVNGDFGDRLPDILSFDQQTEDGITAVQESRRSRSDEKLRCVRIRLAGISQCQNAGTGELKLAADFIGKGREIVRRNRRIAISPIGQISPALDHEILDDPMKIEPVIKALVDQIRDYLDGVGVRSLYSSNTMSPWMLSPLSSM